MKKLFIISTLICGFAILSNAQTLPATTSSPEVKLTESQETQVASTENNAQVVTAQATTSTTVSETPKTKFASVKQQIKEKRAKKRGEMPSFQEKPLYYIGAGVFIAVVVVLYVVTDGEGFSSR